MPKLTCDCNIFFKQRWTHQCAWGTFLTMTQSNAQASYLLPRIHAIYVDFRPKAKCEYIFTEKGDLHNKVSLLFTWLTDSCFQKCSTIFQIAKSGVHLHPHTRERRRSSVHCTKGWPQFFLGTQTQVVFLGSTSWDFHRGSW